MARRILITGGGTGFGRAIAERFLAEAPDLVLVGRRLDVLDTAADELRAGGASSVDVHSCELTDEAAVADLSTALQQGPPIDVLVLNAGGNDPGTGTGLSKAASSWRGNFESNVMTTVLLTEALLDHVARPGGRIVAISSIAGQRGSGAYGGAKAAVHGWMWWMSGRVAADGITVNCVAPGFVPETDFWQPRIKADPRIYDDRVAQIPMGRPGTVQEVAEAVAYLASPAAGWTTGQILGVSGGNVLGR